MRIVRWAGGIAAAIALTVAALFVVADTSIGRRFIVDRIANLSIASGLKIEIGQIEGSIYGTARLKQVRLSDPQGVFLTTGDARLDWKPWRWFTANTLDINELSIAQASLVRLPKFNPGNPDAPILPGFDIRIGRFEIARLNIAKGIAGDARTGRVAGSADISEGRAMVRLAANASAGDRLALVLDAAPDANRFDVEAELSAPAGGIFGQVIGTGQPTTVAITGDGSWQRWQGNVRATASGAQVADIALTADQGRFGLNGRLMLQSVTQGRVRQLTAPVVRVKGEAQLSQRRLAHRLQLISQALTIDARGIADLSENRFDGEEIAVRLNDPKALFANMRGRDIVLRTRLNGPFRSASFDYLLTAPLMQFDATGIEQVRASGQGRLGSSPVAVPIALSAARVTGLGDVAGGILRNLTINGVLRVTQALITGDGLALKSDKLQGKLALVIDLKTGRYDIGLAGQLDRYLIPGLGIVDIKSELKVVPGADGRGSRVLGRGQAWVRRFDNAFLAGLAGGLPYLETGLERGIDGNLRLFNLKITAPSLSLTGNGTRLQNGRFILEGSGRQATYGPFRLALNGDIARPQIDLLLASPNQAAGLRDVRLRLDPSPQGFAWTARGGSMIGPFAGNGEILLPSGAPVTIRIASLNASGLEARGSLVSRTGGLEGRLNLAGSGISGTLDLAPVGTIQRIEAHLRARDARLAGPPLIAARRGQFDGVILLDPRGTSVEGSFSGQGLQRGNLTLARATGNISLRGGAGELRASFAGTRGRDFEFQTVAQIAPNRIQLSGSGTVDRKPVSLQSPAVIVREAGGWRLQPVSLSFAGGDARLAGLFGETATELDATVRQMPLTVLNIVTPQLGLGGTANGTLTYRLPANGRASGRIDMKVRGLTRSGLVLSSRPVDVGITGVLTPGNAAARAIAVSGGQTIGRGQVRITPAGNGVDGLMSGALFAQLRFNGAADTLWRLTGVEGFDVAGPVQIGANATGSLRNPLITGAVRTTNARIESAATGMVLTNVNASGRFGGSDLRIDTLTAKAGNGTVSGSGRFSFAGGLGMDISLQADRAVLLARDDLAATITGPLSLKSDSNGGLISGDVVLNRSAFRLGRATAAAAVPLIRVREINGDQSRRQVQSTIMPWRFAIKARAPGRVEVTGLGIESEWRANLEIGGTITSPSILGEANLVRGGYEFAGKRFELSRGVIRFRGESPPDPILDIVATGDNEGINATIRVTGTGQRPDIAFTSVPALPQDELLSRILFGTSITNLSAPEAVQLAAAVASLQGGGAGLNPINTLRKAIGLDRLRIVAADATTGQGTSVAAGKYITRRLFVEVITDGQGYSATRAEFQITRWLSLLSTISTIGRQSAAARISRDY